MLSYCGGGVISGGGGSSSSNAGGLKDGARIMWMGLAAPLVCTCATGGRASSTDSARGRKSSSEGLPAPSVEYCMLLGEWCRLTASGHPQSATDMSCWAISGAEYAGSDVLACVARHERIWNGESIDISKCRRFLGSTASGFDKRSTIYTCQPMISRIVMRF